MTVSAETGIVAIAEVFPPHRGGSGRWLWELYRRMPQGAVEVFADDHPDAGAFDAAAPFRITRLPLRFTNWGLLHPTSARQYAAAFRRIRARLLDAHPRMVHSAKALPEGALAWTIKQVHGIPYACFAHGEELSLAQSSRELRTLTGRVLTGADRIIANSGHTGDLLEHHWGVSGNRIVVLHPGVDTDRFVPAEQDGSVRASLGWANRRVILTVGALQKRKGQDTVIRALPAIAKAVPDVLYAVAGEDWEGGLHARLAADLGVSAHVQFLGTPPDRTLIDCYQQCDVFALPNRQVGWDFEGFGIALLEAQACAKPVIAGRSGGTSDAVDAPRTGMLVSAESPETLVGPIVELLESADRRHALGAAGREWAVGRFDWSRRVEQACEVLGIPSCAAVGA
jgi:phosphatidylinositol alpha-1,6-mannosyltransferase